MVGVATPPTNPLSEAEDAAREYAWNWFQYHAGQRQAVFRFYLIMCGALSTAYWTAFKSPGTRGYAFAFGIGLIITSFLFWRLDERSAKLIKLAESYLKLEEGRLATILNLPAVRLTERSDSERQKSGILSLFQSFKQIYRWIFVLVSLIGLGFFSYGIMNRI